MLLLGGLGLLFKYFALRVKLMLLGLELSRRLSLELFHLHLLVSLGRLLGLRWHVLRWREVPRRIFLPHGLS